MVSPEMLWSYIAQDRRAAIAAGRDLPSQTHGTALWADLSGFTPLTEALIQKFGPRHGADELGQYLNHFYNAMIAPVDDYGGSVIDFSGDAITCWFDQDDGWRAIAAAQSMQVAAQPFTNLQLAKGEKRISLGVKVAIASGTVRRFQLGDPAIQYIDTLAGAMIDRLAVVGHMAHTGEILLDESTVSRLHATLSIREWRTFPKTGQRAALFNTLNVPVASPGTYVSHSPLTLEQIRPWLLPVIFDQIQSGQGEFLTELCPAVALFMRFDGLNYESDDQVGEKLDTFIRRVQHILVQYEGTLLQLTIGDKGSYLYVAFGAPLTHEDDANRAVAAALDLRLLPGQVDGIHVVSFGISQGLMRMGGYGSKTRRTYGSLGDDVNLAARLMELAASGQILVSESIREVAYGFDWEMLSGLRIKGKQELITPSLLLGCLEQEITDLTQMTTGSPMIGRKVELALIEDKLALARKAQGQIVRIIGEAGIGKSRLLAELLQGITDFPFYGGECHSYAIHTSYQVWQPIWRALFEVDATASLDGQIQAIEDTLRKINPDFHLRLPLLGAVLNLPIPDNSLTSAMDAKARKTSRESLLMDCLHFWGNQHPLILILEDAHWIDPLSADLLTLIAQSIKELPMLILLAHRPFSGADAESFLASFASLDYLTTLNLVELAEEEIRHLVMTRLTYLGHGGHTSPRLVQRISSRAQGNPFYIEELLNYLHDLGLDPRDDKVWEQLDLPESLQSLILSRIDQLSQQQQITIKAASILGRLFRAKWLYEYYPPLGGAQQVFADLEALSRFDLITQENSDAQLTYLFKHVITQEVTYESLSYATRASLHEQFARYLEAFSDDETHPYLDLLAYHYERSNNLPKKREYLRKAGVAAQKAYANDAAIAYLSKALALTPEEDYAERFDLLLLREQIYGILRKLEVQQQDLNTLAALAEALDDNSRRAQVSMRQSNYLFFEGNYSDAKQFAHQAAIFAHQAGDVECESLCYIRWFDASWQMGNIDEAYQQIKQALTLAETAQKPDLIAHCLLIQGAREPNSDVGIAYLERTLQYFRQMGNHHRNEPVVLHNLAECYLFFDLQKAYSYYEQALSCWRIMGDRRYESLGLSRFANLIVEQRGDYAKARLYCEQALPLSIHSHDRMGEMVTIMSFGYIELAENNYEVAILYFRQALSTCREINYPRYEGVSLAKLGMVVSQCGDYAQAMDYHHQAQPILRKLTPEEIVQPLAEMGMIFCYLGNYHNAQSYAQEALVIAKELKLKLEQTRALTILGHIQREQDQLDDASTIYQQAFDLALELNLQHFAKQAQTGLAAIALRRGNLPAALAPLDEILHYLETHPLSTMDEIFWMYLTCYRILQAADDPRAHPTLAVAHRYLQTIAAEINDESLRVSFLQNVRANREIIEAWENLKTEKG